MSKPWLLAAKTKDTLVRRLRDYYTEDETRFHIGHPICDEAADEIDRLAKLLTPTNAELTLMAGEMTAQELRTVRAVLGGIAARVG